MNKSLFLAVLLATAGCQLAAAESPATGAHAKAMPVAAEVTLITARVESTNPKTRTLVIKDAQGNETAIKVGKSVPDFDKIKKGDAADNGATYRVHIIGFAKIVGDLIAGLKSVVMFFFVAVLIATGLLYWYTRCLRSTLVVIVITMGAVVWQLGLLTVLGFELDPYSILVPFLVFAIGVSHGAQKLNGIMQDTGRGCHPYVAARYTFRRLFLAGFTALASDAVGFAVLLIIQIQVIQDLAITASIGVIVLIFTNLILIPVTLSYICLLYTSDAADE